MSRSTALQDLTESTFRLLVQSVKEYAIFMLDPQGIVQSWNPGAERLKGYQASEIIGRPFTLFYPPEDVESGKCARELELAARDGSFEDEGWRVRKDGSRFWANVVITAVFDEGRLVGYAKVTRDLTERRQAEQTRLRLAQASEAVRLRDEFLSVVAHELRTPITALSMLLHRVERAVLRQSQLDPKALVKARRQVQRLSRLVDDLLEFARIQAGRLEFRMEDVTLNALAADVVDDFRDHSDRHSIEFEAGPDTAIVRADPARLEQVLINLLQNAIKYAPNGGSIRVRVWCDDDAAQVSVTDPGIGIPYEDQQRLFQRFYRASNASTPNFSGLGLGLYLCNEIVRRHEGHMSLESVPGHGTTVTVHLPLKEALPSTSPIRGQRLLVVDDEPDILEELGDFLHSEGYEVELARDGYEALGRMRQRPPDVLMVDLRMPLMDGAALVERLRNERLAPQMPIVLFSADQHVHSRAAALEVDAALAKPLDLDEVLGVLQRVSLRPGRKAAPHANA